MLILEPGDVIALTIDGDNTDKGIGGGNWGGFRKSCYGR
jgi:hypothetical protein